jgi:hypothetical protein
MENMIQQMAIEFVKKLCGHFGERGVYEFGEMAEDGKRMSDEFVGKLIVAFIESADKALLEAKSERKDDGITIHERDVSRTQFTALGSLTYRRTYFDTPDGRSYILDGVLGVRAYERIDTSVSASMANSAGELSFGRSADIVTGGRVSRQTVRMKAMQIGEVCKVPARVAKTPEVLHIFADEDHVHMQNGKSRILPLVTVCAGKELVCKGRNALKDPIHINGYGIKPDNLWSYVYAVCAEKYDMDKVRKVIVYGDAAKWIGVSSDFLPDPLYVLDDYHFQKRMKSLVAGAICGRFAKRVRNAVENDRPETFKGIIYEMEDAVMSEAGESIERRKRLRHIKEEGAFILAHWEEIQNRKDSDSIGSCTEALISHVLSERFSRNPMGWSVAGLEKMSMIRVFLKNGGRIMPCDVGCDRRTDEERRTQRGRTDKYARLVQEQERKLLAGMKNWRWLKGEDCIISQARSGTREAIKLLGKTRNIS